MPPPTGTSFLKGRASPGDALWEKNSWTGLDDWRKIISTCAEVTACPERGYGKESVQRSLQLTAHRENQCGRKRKEVCRDEFEEADFNKSHRRLFSQEIYLVDQEGSKLSR